MGEGYHIKGSVSRGIKYHSPSAKEGLVLFRSDNNRWQNIRLSLEGRNPVRYAPKYMIFNLGSLNLNGLLLSKMNFHHLFSLFLLFSLGLFM